MGGYLTEQAVILAAVETVPGTPEVNLDLDVDANGVVAINPSFSLDINRIENNAVRPDLDTNADRAGRTVSTLSFDIEYAGNGEQNSGDTADAPKICDLLRACGYQLNAAASGDETPIASITPDPDNAVSGAGTAITFRQYPDYTMTGVNFAFEPAGDPTVTVPVLYCIEVTTGGAPGAPTFEVTCSDEAEDGGTFPESTTLVDDATSIDLGDKGGSVTVHWNAGTVQVGDKWYIWVTPTGTYLSPVSSSIDALTIWAYFNNTRHRMSGCQGTFSFNAEAGGIATFSFEFRGEFTAADTDTMPTSFPQAANLPPVVENGSIAIGCDNAICVSSVEVTQNNTMADRADFNGPQGVKDVRIVSRDPGGSFDPEQELETTSAFWGRFEAGSRTPFSFHVGATAGNGMGFYAPRAQSTELGYGDRDGIRTYEQGMNFRRADSGNDAMFWVFY